MLVITRGYGLKIEGKIMEHWNTPLNPLVCIHLRSRYKMTAALADTDIYWLPEALWIQWEVLGPKVNWPIHLWLCRTLLIASRFRKAVPVNSLWMNHGGFDMNMQKSFWSLKYIPIYLGRPLLKKCRVDFQKVTHRPQPLAALARQSSPPRLEA